MEETQKHSVEFKKQLDKDYIQSDLDLYKVQNIGKTKQSVQKI